MDNKYNILHTFEQKLKESIENSKTQDSVINGLRNALNESLNERQRVINGLRNALNESLNERQRLEALAEKESEKCHHLNDLLTKRQIESKIAIETQTIEWREEKALLDNQMKRLTDQMSDAKHNACQLQNKCSQLQQSLAAKDSEVEKQSAFKTTIGSEIRQLHETIGTLRQEFSALTKTHGELKNLIQMENDMNCGLKRQLKEQYEELVSVKNEKCLLETQLSEFKTKLNANSGLLYEKDLQSLRLNQTNEMCVRNYNYNEILIHFEATDQ
ncbi:unnamed protein product [Medioppia subpectinata]|uniref:Uncharacterized protein n=1 Tax=Medioppia subpectinata TaxID=1979941 RepID=A0A7R9KXQ3_9ACAR|nr:unnamed protein product [Medioppia subpectinata]CAG2111777.1 unnamed protein product [Medioppia subpectinata]